MADPLSVTASVLAVGGFAFKSSTLLYDTIRSFQSQNKQARALKAEIGDLTAVLESLLETVSSNPEIDFRALELPLQRCGNACEEYLKIVLRCTKHSDGSRSSVRDWIKQQYLQGDIDDFRTMLAIHKSTINIALANANLSIAVVSPEVLADYKDMISDTTCDLNAYLEDLQVKITRLKDGDATAVDDIANEWTAMIEEKQNTQQGLKICAELSAQIARFESGSTEHPLFSDRPSAKKHIKSGFGEARGSINTAISRLQNHEAFIDNQIATMSLDDSCSSTVAAQLTRLQKIKDSINQCIGIVSDAGDAADERCNIFEDLDLSENSYALSVSTVNELVTARRLTLRGRSRHLGGQVTDETVQKSIEALTRLDVAHIKSESSAQRGGYGASDKDSDTGELKGVQELRDHRQFDSRFGPGISLSVGKSG